MLESFKTKVKNDRAFRSAAEGMPKRWQSLMYILLARVTTTLHTKLLEKRLPDHLMPLAVALQSSQGIRTAPIKPGLSACRMDVTSVDKQQHIPV